MLKYFQLIICLMKKFKITGGLQPPVIFWRRVSGSPGAAIYVNQQVAQK